MAVYTLTSSWTQIDLAGGVAQNRGNSTIECARSTTTPQAHYILLLPKDILSAVIWGGDTVYVRKSQTSSQASAILVVE